MGRARQTPPLPFTTVISADPVAGARLAFHLHRLKAERRGRPGRSVRFDRFAAALLAAEQHPPTATGTKRRKPCRGSPITPQREIKAVELLQQILQPTGRVVVVLKRKLSATQRQRTLERALVDGLQAGNTGNMLSAADALHRLQIKAAAPPRGEFLTIANATRIIEQVRRLAKAAG
ncbi:hypothetical protein ACFOD4_00455 [Pseudoroseomonas globiformis]|uniref:Uncharacterized protein n=1 Tax=Teichococcus globiformis TaxID=2307229 RepID=A0ABV7FT52_9PROT